MSPALRLQHEKCIWRPGGWQPRVWAEKIHRTWDEMLDQGKHGLEVNWGSQKRSHLGIERMTSCLKRWAWAGQCYAKCPATMGNVTMMLRTGSESEVTQSRTEASLSPLKRRYTPNTHYSTNILRGRNRLKDRVGGSRKMFEGTEEVVLIQCWIRPGLSVHSSHRQERLEERSQHGVCRMIQDGDSLMEGRVILTCSRTRTIPWLWVKQEMRAKPCVNVVSAFMGIKKKRNNF